MTADNDDVAINRLLSTSNPQEAFGILLRDYTHRMRHRGVTNNVLQGMQIALKLSYRLGEKAGIQRILDAKEER